jgi:hypothetical protein
MPELPRLVGAAMLKELSEFTTGRFLQGTLSKENQKLLDIAKQYENIMPKARSSSYESESTEEGKKETHDKDARAKTEEKPLEFGFGFHGSGAEELQSMFFGDQLKKFDHGSYISQKVEEEKASQKLAKKRKDQFDLTSHTKDLLEDTNRMFLRSGQGAKSFTRNEAAEYLDKLVYYTFSLATDHLLFTDVAKIVKRQIKETYSILGSILLESHIWCFYYLTLMEIMQIDYPDFKELLDLVTTSLPHTTECTEEETKKLIIDILVDLIAKRIVFYDELED